MSGNLDTKIREALDKSQLAEARSLLQEALKDSPTEETYFQAARAAIDDEQKIKFLEKALELNQFHEEAYIELKRLKGVRPTSSRLTTTSQPNILVSSNLRTHQIKPWVIITTLILIVVVIVIIVFFITGGLSYCSSEANSPKR